MADELPTPPFKEPTGQGWDKAMHFGAGALAGEFGRAASRGIGEATGLWKKDSKTANVVGPMASAVLAGVLKEYLDSQDPHNKFDVKDAAATALGALPGAGIRFTWKYGKGSEVDGEGNTNTSGKNFGALGVARSKD